MKIGLMDVDGHKFPNIPLMKLSAYHKDIMDDVGWWREEGEYDIVYKAKVFEFTEDVPDPTNTKKIVRGGTGYFYPDGGEELPYMIEHMYPDYSLYPELTEKTAYGFLTRGCPRGCDFCIVGHKEGRRSHKVADLSEFWNGQKYIEICDPNMFAAKEWRELSEQLIDTKSYINFNQGCDIRSMSEEQMKMVSQMKIKTIHFAWDRMKDEKQVIEGLKKFKEITGWGRRKIVVYVLCNFDTTIEEDLYRINKLRELDCWAYVMIYDKSSLPRGHKIKKLQRWVNNRFIFESVPTFEEYLSNPK